MSCNKTLWHPPWPPNSYMALKASIDSSSGANGFASPSPNSRQPFELRPRAGDRRRRGSDVDGQPGVHPGLQEGDRRRQGRQERRRRPFEVPAQLASLGELPHTGHPPRQQQLVAVALVVAGPLLHPVGATGDSGGWAIQQHHLHRERRTRGRRFGLFQRQFLWL